MHQHDAPAGRGERTRRRLYGRRKGKGLSAAQQGRMETLLPQVRLPLRPGQPLDPAALFSQPTDDLWLEIGFGIGDHLAARAAAHPQTGFIGCEPYVNGAAKLLGRIETGELGNIRVWDDDARDVLEALPPQSVGRILLLYPDPWPKFRHWKRRFVQVETLEVMARVLRPGRELLVATDIADYARWTLEQVYRHARTGHAGRFEWTATAEADWRDAPAGWPGTKYERKALAAGRRPIYLAFRRA